MPKLLNQVRDWKRGGRASAGAFNAVLAAVRGLYQSPLNPGIIDSSGTHPRQRLQQVVVDQFQLVSESDDYLTCKRYDGTNATREEKIAKPPHLRGAIATRTVNDEDQEISPPYAEGDLIYAVRPRGGTSVIDEDNVPVRWLDISPRRWAAVCEE